MTATLTPVRKRSALTKGQLPKYAPYVVLGARPDRSAPPSSR